MSQVLCILSMKYKNCIQSFLLMQLGLDVSAKSLIIILQNLRICTTLVDFGGVGIKGAHSTH